MIPLVHFVFKVLFLFSFLILFLIYLFIFLLNIERTPSINSPIPVCLFLIIFFDLKRISSTFFILLRYDLYRQSPLTKCCINLHLLLTIYRTPPCCTILLASERVVQSLESTNIVRISIPSANLSASYSNVKVASTRFVCPPLTNIVCSYLSFSSLLLHERSCNFISKNFFCFVDLLLLHVPVFRTSSIGRYKK